nr:MAG TPA: hypothetical protein [Caudoviricetes sp.]
MTLSLNLPNIKFAQTYLRFTFLLWCRDYIIENLSDCRYCFQQISYCN